MPHVRSAGFMFIPFFFMFFLCSFAFPAPKLRCKTAAFAAVPCSFRKIFPESPLSPAFFYTIPAQKSRYPSATAEISESGTSPPSHSASKPRRSALLNSVSFTKLQLFSSAPV